MRNKWIIKSFLAYVALPVRMLFLAVAVLGLAVAGSAKMYEEPKSFSLQDKSLEQVERKTLPKVDAERLMAEDKARDKDRQHPAPMRIAVAVNTAFNLDNSGTWQTLSDGRLWRLRIQSPGAISHNLGITRFDMPEGAKLWIYDPAHRHVEGPYTSRNRSKSGSLWTPIIEGDEIVVEVFVPANAAQPVVQIGRVNQGYRGLGKSGLFGGSEGTCQNDVICPVGNPWHDQIRAVAVYTISNTLGSGGCTGTLINDTAHDFKNYFLSANHCLADSGDPASVVVYWNFQSPTCGPHGPGDTTHNQTGASLRANYAPSDFALFELSAAPDPSDNVFYAGWDATGTAPPSTVGIHHPSVDVKAISFSNTATRGADWTGAGDGGALDPAGNHWRIDWDSGCTEGGSSGSCIFSTTNKRCVGQLHGGPSACGPAIPSATEHDYYGKFSVSWFGGGTAATQLKAWLDSGNTGVLGLDGDPHITTLNGIQYDFQSAGEFISLLDPDGLEIQTRQTPIPSASVVGNTYTGLTTCVSLNTAVAARVNKHRVTYEPNLSGVPDPSGLQLRVDGALTTLGPNGFDLGEGSRIAKTAAPGGLEVDFPDSTVLLVTPNWWPGPNQWYLNVDAVRPAATDGGSPGSFATGGIAGPIGPDSWLPALPDGTLMGPRPGPLHDRFVELYRKFADAWRVTDKTSLFDYAPGTSTDTFTLRSWPPENPPCTLPNRKPVRPASRLVAERACLPVLGDNAHNNCVFDVMVTGNIGFAKTYQLSQRIQATLTTTTVGDNKNPTRIEEPISFTATVASFVAVPNALAGNRVPYGTVQFMVDGVKADRPVKLDAQGQAVWKTSELKPGGHKVAASFIPSPGSAFAASSSPNEQHTVLSENGEKFR